MANTVFNSYKQALLKACANADLDTDTTTDGVFCSLVDTGTVAFATSLDFYNDIATAVIGTDQRVTSPTVSGRVFDGGDLTYTAVTTATSVEALALHRKNSGANTTWRLVIWDDTGVGGLPVTPNGGNITITWATTGIFGL